MKIPKRIIHKISRIIKDTSAPYSQVLPDTQRDLFPQLLFGLLSSGSAYASDVARKIEGVSIGAKEMKVLRFVHHPKFIIRPTPGGSHTTALKPYGRQI